MTTQFDNVTVLKQGNVYFDGKCVSHTVVFADGSKKTLGVILPSSLTFSTGVAEIMDVTSGSCRVRQKDQQAWTTYSSGESFEVPANSSFDIETLETLNYVCNYA
ncbi:pyrimidine/purine nucleoside phosphorylase [Collimonas fungivorans]|uniref:Pyrimidine/purine nucleoside phosphorylase n=1 Tax=Collimonas fungivorans (strain Ter331) TaxID=1005048 RepID=G0ACV2_COLFT|nr:pyrimidine/purine nucleoside phosphorylase [Collimonas fungivorans]AEK63057.1 Putative cytoplasmic protein [Collimonas fungivorans Ter331]